MTLLTIDQFDKFRAMRDGRSFDGIFGMKFKLKVLLRFLSWISSIKIFNLKELDFDLGLNLYSKIRNEISEFYLLRVAITPIG